MATSDEDKKEILNLLVEAIQQPVLILDSTFSVSDANTAFFRSFGFEPHEVHGQHLFQLRNNEWDIPQLRRLLEEVHSNAFPLTNFEIEYDFPKLGRKILRLSARKFLPEETPESKIILSMDDVTERVKTQMDLLDSEIRYRRLFETAHDGILLLNFETGRIDDANPYLIQLLAYTREDLVGKELWEIGLFENIEASRAVFRELQEKGFVRFENLPLQSKDGSRIEVEFVCNVYPIGSKNLIQCNIRDVSVRKKAEAIQLQSEQRLRRSQKLEAVGKLAGGIAHDFNNLLTAVNGYSELCLSLPEAKGALREHLLEIRGAGERAAELTRKILAFSQQQILSSKVLDLNAIVGDLEKLLSRSLGGRIHLEDALDPNIGRVKADPGQMEQVIINLALNAHDAMPAGGTLKLRTQDIVVRETPGNESGMPPGRYARLSVSDTGTGMTRELQARIFDPFFTTKDISKGAGLGLSVVQGIIAQSGGYINVDSEPGRGTTFNMDLPVIDAPPAEPRIPVPEPQTWNSPGMPS